MFRPIPGGLLIAIEGIDGAGKTTVAALLAQWCGERAIGCLISKEPTGMKWGTELRQSAKEKRLSVERELELFELDRRDHVARSINPALAENNVVILDRYYWSTAAYQGARGRDVDELMRMNEVFAPVPDLVILLDIDVDAGLQRIRMRGDSPNSFETKKALSRSRHIFCQLAEKHTYCRMLDSSGHVKDTMRDALAAFQRTAINKISRSRPLDAGLVNNVLNLFGEPSIPVQDLVPAHPPQP